MKCLYVLVGVALGGHSIALSADEARPIGFPRSGPVTLFIATTDLRDSGAAAARTVYGSVDKIVTCEGTNDCLRRMLVARNSARALAVVCRSVLDELTSATEKLDAELQSMLRSLRVLQVISDVPTNCLVPGNSSIQSFGELEGQRVGFVTADDHMLLGSVASKLAISLVPVQVPLTSAVDQLTSGEIKALVYSGQLSLPSTCKQLDLPDGLAPQTYILIGFAISTRTPGQTHIANVTPTCADCRECPCMQFDRCHIGVTYVVHRRLVGRRTLIRRHLVRVFHHGE